MESFKWTPLKHRAAYLLATEPKRYYEIADMLGVTVQTLWNWRQNKDFTRTVNKISNEEIRLRIKTRVAVDLKLPL